MGTRNLTMVIDRNGETKVAQYGQWDGYPSGQGVTVLEFARNKENISRLENEFKNIKFWNKCDDIKQYIEEYDNRCPKWDEETPKMLPDNRTEEDCYWFKNTQKRDVCAEILYTIIDIDKRRLPKEHNGTIYLYDESDFGKDSLMCEWAYCINLQTNKLECFTGFNQNKDKEHKRFATIQEEVDKDFSYADYRYYGIKLVKEYDLDNLPTKDDFVKELEAQESEND